MGHSYRRLGGSRQEGTPDGRNRNSRGTLKSITTLAAKISRLVMGYTDVPLHCEGFGEVDVDSGDSSMIADDGLRKRIQLLEHYDELLWCAGRLKARKQRETWRLDWVKSSVQENRRKLLE